MTLEKHIYWLYFGTQLACLSTQPQDEPHKCLRFSQLHASVIPSQLGMLTLLFLKGHTWISTEMI